MSLQTDSLLPSTRLSSMRVLYAGYVHSGSWGLSMGSIAHMQMLLSMRAHITFVAADGELGEAQRKYYLQYMGVDVTPKSELRFAVKPERKKDCVFDLVIVNHKTSYQAMLLILRTQCAEAPVIFIASDLCFLSDAQHHRADAEMEQNEIKCK